MKKLIILLTVALLSVNTFSQSFNSSPHLQYYQDTYDKAKQQARTGTVLTIAGLACGSLGYFMARHTMYQGNGTYTANGTAMFGSILFLGGVVLTNVGIPLWISGTIIAKNNEEAILGNFSLQSGLYSNGLGFQLVLKL